MDKAKRRAGQIGGARRAEILPPDRRSEIAKRAALARWGARQPIAVLSRMILELMLIATCSMTSKKRPSSVSVEWEWQSDWPILAALHSPRFIGGEKIAPYVGGELREKLKNPLVFQGPTMGVNMPPVIVHGYDVTILIDLCKAIIKAESEGKLLKRQERIANQARIILGASAKAGIKDLVYRLSGYDATREEAIAAFKFYVREEARDYEREFPNQLYQEWYRLYQLRQSRERRGSLSILQ